MAPIAVTEWEQEADRERSKAAGFVAHMDNPAEFTALTKLLAVVADA